MEKKIDKEYMGNLKEKRRISQIADIDSTDEYIEPNHEAEALEAIMQISRKYKD